MQGYGKSAERYINETKNLQINNGVKFFNQHFKKLMKKYKINSYSVFSEKRVAVLKRLKRSLESLMWREFSYQGSYKRLKILPKIVHTYNNR